MHVDWASEIQLGDSVRVVVLAIINCTHSPIFIHDLVISVNILKEAELCHHFEVCALIVVLSGTQIVFIHNVLEFVGARARQVSLLCGVLGVVLDARDVWGLVATNFHVHQSLHERCHRSFVGLRL